MDCQVRVLITVLRGRSPHRVRVQGSWVELGEPRPVRAIRDRVSGHNEGVDARWVHSCITWGWEATKGAPLSSFHEVTEAVRVGAVWACEP